MSRFGGRQKTDANQAAIVKALRQAGATVQSLHQIGKGCPDLLVGYCGRNWLFEVKDGDKPPSAQALTKDEQAFCNMWEGDIRVVTSVENALNLLLRVLPR